jgi:hypothetical protein
MNSPFWIYLSTYILWRILSCGELIVLWTAALHLDIKINCLILNNFRWSAGEPNYWQFTALNCPVVGLFPRRQKCLAPFTQYANVSFRMPKFNLVFCAIRDQKHVHTNTHRTFFSIFFDFKRINVSINTWFSIAITFFEVVAAFFYWHRSEFKQQFVEFISAFIGDK